MIPKTLELVQFIKQRVTIVFQLTLLLTTCVFSGCCAGFHLSHNCPSEAVAVRTELLPSYKSFHFLYEGHTHLVYFRLPTRGRTAPPILILHEMPALTHECLDLADRLCARGYAVYLPLLFGEAEPHKVGRWTFLKSLEWFPVTR